MDRRAIAFALVLALGCTTEKKPSEERTPDPKPSPLAPSLPPQTPLPEPSPVAPLAAQQVPETQPNASPATVSRPPLGAPLAPPARTDTPPPATHPPVSGLDPANFDPSVRVQDDLFRAVNGTWLKKTEIPADRSSYGAFAMLGDKSEADVREIIETAANDKGAPGTEAQKVGDLYSDYMEEVHVDELGRKPIEPELTTVRLIETKADFLKAMATLRQSGISSAFRIHVGPDAKKPDRNLLEIGQDGLGLPDREYYLDAKHKDKLAAYETHVAHMLALAGVADSVNVAKAVVALETQIARAHWTKEETRDDDKTYNKLSRADLKELAPELDWDLFLDGLGANAALEVVVGQPSYISAFAKLIDAVSLDTWKAWLDYRVIHRYAEYLDKETAGEEFNFYGTTLRGAKKQRPRWKRAVGAVQQALGEAVGKLYVQKHYPAEAQERMEALVSNLIAAFRERIKGLDWMTPATKEKALAKLAAFTPKIGHPRVWRDYTGLEIKRDDLVGNVRRTAAFEWGRNLDKLVKPVDRNEWFMTPQTVNAYYNSNMNEIVFPAAILQPPFFDLQADDAVNYGGIGAVIGHEIGHGFDDQGSKWDGAGNLSMWWTPEDRAEFDKRANALAAQYDKFEPLPGFHVNGRLTLGENMGDYAGAVVALTAYHMSLQGKTAPVIDGLTGDQRFFMGFAQVWRGKQRDDDLKNQIMTNPHSPAEFRANGTVRNVPGFYEAFGVKEGDKMYLPPEARVRIW